jgi:MoxR-like ATPase
VDRFMLKIVVSYPSKSDEHMILKRMAKSAPVLMLTLCLPPDDVKRIRELTDEI